MTLRTFILCFIGISLGFQLKTAWQLNSIEDRLDACVEVKNHSARE
jgi:hypothetical protein